MTKKKTAENAATNPTMQKELIIVMVLSLLLGLSGGYLLGISQDESTSSDAAVVTSEVEAVMQHPHSKYEVALENAPKVELVVTEDAKSGYNIKILTTDFIFTPESVNGENVIGEGHAHLYVDGEKVGRLYSPYYHYDGSFEGTKTFSVTLNANDHGEYAIDGEVISTEVQITHNSSDQKHQDSHSSDNTDAMKTEEDVSHSDMQP
jgi:hypothetical protein